jgi:hypothetical protein
MPELRVKNTNVANYQLIVYAPGDGALAFTWVNKKNNQADGYLIVTRQDVDKYLASPNGKNHSNEYHVVIINSELRICKTVTRTNTNTLVIDKLAYTYQLAPEGKAQLDENTGKLSGHYVTFYFDHDGVSYEVKNWSTRATLMFFLNHEKTLTCQNA